MEKLILFLVADGQLTRNDKNSVCRRNNREGLTPSEEFLR